MHEQEMMIRGEQLLALHEQVSRIKFTPKSLLPALLAAKLPIPEKARRFLFQETANPALEVIKVGEEIGSLMNLTPFEASVLGHFFFLRILRQTANIEESAERELVVMVKERSWESLQRELEGKAGIDREQYDQWVDTLAQASFILGSLFSQTQIVPSYVGQKMIGFGQKVKSQRIEDEDLNDFVYRAEINYKLVLG